MHLTYLYKMQKLMNLIRVHNAASGNKFRINAQDGVIGATSTELRNEILQQLPNDPRKTKQLV